MTNRIAFIFPGQGAQYPGMGRDFYEKYPEAKAVFDRADALLERPFSKLIFDGPKEELTLTKNSQLAIFITSVAILEVFKVHYPDMEPVLCAGLSLGEYTALVAAGYLSFEEALPIVEARGQYMHEACEANRGVMHVVLGLDLEAVEKVTAPIDGVWIANLNCPGQIVLSGTPEGVEAAAALLKEAGARRVMPLDVSGAFHSGLMQSAQDRLEPMIQEASLSPSTTDIVMNVPGNFTRDLNEMRGNMTQQVTQSVLWQKGIEAILDRGIDLFIEMGPGKTLAGMNKRIGVTLPTISIENVEDLQGASQHATLS